MALLDNHASDLSTFDFEKVKIDFNNEFLTDVNLKDTGYFQNQFKNDAPPKIERIPYPITIVVTKEDYDEWIELKRQMGEENDLKAFKKGIKFMI